jgi:hypothetical protein
MLLLNWLHDVYTHYLVGLVLWLNKYPFSGYIYRIECKGVFELV